MANAFYQFEPKLQMRFEMVIENSGLESMPWMLKSTTMPNIDNNPIVIDYINADFRVKGKSRWQPVSITFYDSIEFDTAKTIGDWLKNKHHNSQSGIDGYAFGGYKTSVSIRQLTPDLSAFKQFTLHGAFIANTNFGAHDLSSDEPVLVEMELSYDWADVV